MIKRIISLSLAMIMLTATLLSVASCSAFITLKSPFLTDAVVVATDSFKITGTMFSAAIYSDYNAYCSAMRKYDSTYQKSETSIEDFLNLPARTVWMAVNYYSGRTPVSTPSSFISTLFPGSNGGYYTEDKFESPSNKVEYYSYNSASADASSMFSRPSTSFMQGNFITIGGTSNTTVSQSGMNYTIKIDLNLFDKTPISAWNGDESLTYSDVALIFAKQIIGKCEYAKAKGVSVDESVISKARDELVTAINIPGLFTADEYIKQAYGNTTIDEIVKFLEVYYLSKKAEELIVEEFEFAPDSDEMSRLVEALIPEGGFRDILYVEVVDYIPNGLRRYYDSIGGYEQNYEAHRAKLDSIIDRLRNASNDETFINAAKEYIHMAAFYDFFERMEDNLGENYFYEMAAYVVEDAVAYLDNLKLVIDSYFFGDDNYGAPVSVADSKFPSEFEDAFIYASSGAINRIDNLFYYELAAMSEVKTSSNEFARWIFDDSTETGDTYYAESEKYSFSSGNGISSGSISSMDRRTVKTFARMSNKYAVSNHSTYSFATVSFALEDRFYSMLHSAENLLEKVEGDNLVLIKEVAGGYSTRYKLWRNVSFSGYRSLDRWLSTRSGEIPDKSLIVTGDGAVAVFMVGLGYMTSSECKAYNVHYSRELSRILEEYCTAGNMIVNSNIG